MTKSTRRHLGDLRRLLLIAALFLGACTTVMPALKALAVAFGQDLLASAAVNHAPRYAIQLEALLAIMARESTGLNFQPQLVQAGYQTPLPAYLQQQQQGQQQRQQPAYGGGYSGGYSNAAGGRHNGASPPASTPPITLPQDPHVNGSDPYAEGTASGSADVDPYNTGEDPYVSTDDPYVGAEDPYVEAGDPYSDTAYRTRSGSAPVGLGVALLVQRGGHSGLETIENGAVLRDGRGEPTRGDLIKVHFRSNCDCYVYVIGVDATGYVAQIFPDPNQPSGNPVRAGRDYLLPGAGEYWALDQQRGVENVYFVAARTPRPDLEETLMQLSATTATRQATGETRAVARPAPIPPTRGMVKVKVSPQRIPAGNSSTVIAPDAFVSTLDDVDLIVSRWFRHE